MTETPYRPKGTPLTVNLIHITRLQIHPKFTELILTDKRHRVQNPWSNDCRGVLYVPNHTVYWIVKPFYYLLIENYLFCFI